MNHLAKPVQPNSIDRALRSAKAILTSIRGLLPGFSNLCP